jgi:Flp pilus assembly protein TadD
MNGALRALRPVLLCAGMLVLQACATTQTSSLPSVQADAPRPDAERSIDITAQAVALLEKGRVAEAQAALASALRLQPDNAAARELMDELGKDPNTLFGAHNFSYRTKQGETLADLAERFLGDRLLFYALARYNGLAAPDQLAVGQILKIPQIGRPTHRTVESAPARRAPETAVAVAPRPPAPPRDPACSKALRAQALEQLNRGQVDQAVVNLRHALQCDAGNASASHDLDRALRLQAMAHAR